MTRMHGYRPPVANPNDIEAVSARRIRVFFDLDDGALGTGEEIERAQTVIRGLGTLLPTIADIDLSAPDAAEVLDGLPYLTDWLNGGQTRQVAETHGVSEGRIDALRKTAQNLIGNEAVYHAMLTTP